jgi:DNA-binding CsgD family transcriptional regulator
VAKGTSAWNLDGHVGECYDGRVGVTVVSVVGREEELRRARAVLGESRSGIVVFRGEPGIGKTTLWEAATAAAAAAGRRVLVARPIEAERRLGLAAFADLLQPVAAEVLPKLPPPQRRALEAALLLADAEGGPPDPRTLGAALVSSLRVIGGERGALLAVDDFQWADAASRAVLAFALRRLSMADASAVLAVRAGDANEGLPPFDDQVVVSFVDLGPLSLGALRRLVSDRLGGSLPRPLLRRLHDASGGNPLYALEIARALQDAGPVPADQDLPVPSDLDALLRERISALAPSARRALAAAAALSESRVELIEREGDLRPALDAGLIRVERGVVRFNHPLLASAAYSLLAPRRRRELHARLARVVDDIEQRARHLALAHPRPDESVAVVLEAAAERALARGAPVAAGELLELALARTADAQRMDARRVAAAQAYWRAGEAEAARPLAEEAVVQLEPGPERARMLVLLSSLRRSDLPTAFALAQQAWTEADGDAAAEGLAAAQLSFISGFSGDFAGALMYAQHALDRAAELPDRTLAAVIADAAFMQLTATGRTDRDLLAQGLAAEERAGGFSYHREVRLALGIQLLLEERYAEARAELERVVAVIEALGYESRLQELLNVLSEIETRSGRPAVGAALASRAADIRTRLGIDRFDAMAGYFSALAAAYLGRVDEVRMLTEAGLAAAAEAGDAAFGTQHAAVIGFLELSLGNAEAAVEVLAPVAGRLAAIAPGIHPMHVPVLPNLIEALIALGRLDEARVHLERLEKRGRELDSAWALAQAARARGLMAAAEGDHRRALARFEEALHEHERTGPFERGRTLLARGAVLRRGRQWRAARESLTAALAIFEEVEAELWAEKARAELRRISGRSAADGLTPTEERIAQLVAAGRSNKEIASELFVTVRTVETHLTHVYAKLGVHSRTELVSRLSA